MGRGNEKGYSRPTGGTETVLDAFLQGEPRVLLRHANGRSGTPDIGDAVNIWYFDKRKRRSYLGEREGAQVAVSGANRRYAVRNDR